MELLRKVIRLGEVIAFHSIVKQRPQRACSVRSHLTESLESITSFRALFRITGMNSQRCEIKLIKVIVGLFLYRGRELFLLLGKISFSASQPACDDVKSRRVPISWSDPIERFSRYIELSKAQGRRSKIELTIRVFWKQSRYFFAPRDGLFEVLFFRCLCQNVERR